MFEVPVLGNVHLAAAGKYPRYYTTNVRGRGETLFVMSPVWRKWDFLGDLIDDEFNVCLGSDAQAAGALVAGQASGLVRLTSGNNSGTASDDIAMLNAGLNFLSGTGGHFGVECRMRMNTAVTGGTMGFGVTDVHSTTGSTEEPSSYATATLTTNASNGAGFLFDTAATTDDWLTWGVNADTDTDASHSGAIPVADAFDILRLEIDPACTARYYINDVLVKTVTGAVASGIPLGLYAYVNATTTASVVVDVDYVAVWADRY